MSKNPVYEGIYQIILSFVEYCETHGKDINDRENISLYINSISGSALPPMDVKTPMGGKTSTGGKTKIEKIVDIDALINNLEVNINSQNFINGLRREHFITIASKLGLQFTAKATKSVIIAAIKTHFKAQPVSDPVEVVTPPPEEVQNQTTDINPRQAKKLAQRQQPRMQPREEIKAQKRFGLIYFDIEDSDSIFLLNDDTVYGHIPKTEWAAADDDAVAPVIKALTSREIKILNTHNVKFEIPDNLPE